MIQYANMASVNDMMCEKLYKVSGYGRPSKCNLDHNIPIISVSRPVSLLRSSAYDDVLRQ